MSLEVPVIAICSTSIPEILATCGLYFDPYSIESLDKAVKEFVSDSESHNLDFIRKAAKKEPRVLEMKLLYILKVETKIEIYECYV